MLMLIFCFELLFYPHLAVGDTRPLRYAVDEESRKNTFIGNIIADTGINTNLVLQLHSADGKADQYLKLENPSGNLYTSNPIDREEICPVSERICHIEAAVQVALGKWINIFVEIKDINDHKPKFPQTHYHYSLSENIETGYLLRLELAQDEDSGVNNVLSYELDKRYKYFVLLRNKDDGLFLKVEMEMDYENIEMRETSMKLVACDSGKPKLCGFTNLIISLKDVNDNAPRFSKPIYETLINETIDIKVVFITIVAIDMDSGDNGIVKYSISDSTNPLVRNYFHINDRGEMSTIQRLDFLEMEETEVKILAEDMGSPPLRSTCIIKIKILDINNHKPEIKITPDSSLSVMENKPINYQVGLVSVIDRDKGANGDTNCVLVGAKFTLKMKHENKINNKDFYIIMTTRTIDREIDSQFSISILCTDKGSPSLSSFANITVAVLDENEYYPTWTKSNFTVAVSEDVDIFKNIIQITAKDKDATANLTYQFLSESSNQFSLNPYTGWISTKGQLDREETEICKLTCYVIDNSGSRTYTSMTIVTIILLDVNDNPPILQPPKTFHILENIGNPSTLIGQLIAIDYDQGENAKIKFEIIKIIAREGVKSNDDIPLDVFHIDRDKGQIFSSTTLDREEVSLYTITIRLIDKGLKPLKTEENIEIMVLDENDNKPLWNLPNKTFNFTLPFDLTSPVLYLKAIDHDSEKNANITYILLTKSEFFRLHSISGQLYPSKSLKEGVYKLIFQACDNGEPPNYSEEIVITIKVWQLVNEDKERIESLLIIIISSATCVVFLCLLSAIAIVRWQRDPHENNIIIKENEDDIDRITLNKWTDHQNQYTLSIANQYYQPLSLASQDQFQTCEKCNGEMLNCDNTTCSIIHFRHPLIQELEMSSADSGKGTIEEENLLSDYKVKPRNFIPMNSPYQTPVLSKFSSTFLTANYCDTLRQGNSKDIIETDLDSSVYANEPYCGISSENIHLNSFLSL